MPFQAYVDDSGGKGQGPVFVLAGLIGKAQDWATFSDLWRRAMHARPRIEYFKMHEAAHRHGQFKGFSPQQRDRKIRRLVRVLDSFGFRFIQVATDLAGHADTFSVHSEKPLSEPYFFPFHITIMSVLYDVMDREDAERFEIIFDQNVIFGLRAKLWYPIIRSLMDPDEQALLPVEPIFKTDDEVMPLQAADFFAWLFRRAWSSDAQAFGWVVSELKKTKVSMHSQLLTRGRLAKIVRQSYAINVAPEVAQRYREMFGL